MSSAPLADSALPQDEATFRALLDPRGLLRPGALLPPPRSAGFVVFSQALDVALDAPAIDRQAARFFDARVGLSVEKDYAAGTPTEDAARVVLSAGDAGGTRLCFGRRTEADDVAAAEAAELAQGSYGLSLLAQRCPTLWLIVTEREDDRTALTLAAIFASVMLGPILAPPPRSHPRGDAPPLGAGPGNGALFGVRTARMRLETHARPYR